MKKILLIFISLVLLSCQELPPLTGTHLSCAIDVMGGVEFGRLVFKGLDVKKEEDGGLTATVNLGTGEGSIMAIPFTAFVDASNSHPGFYNDEGIVQDADFTVSQDSVKNEKKENTRYVTSMSFPVSKEVSEYILWIYINSNVMGVQFCDGLGSAKSNQPNERSKYLGKLTIDWENQQID